VTEQAERWEAAAVKIAAKLNAANEILEALLDDIRRRRVLSANDKEEPPHARPKP
jgi:hypothetical protein